jgi:hypothetical protein
MIIKNHLSKVAIVGVLGMAFLTQPVQAYAWGGGWGWRGGWGWGWPVAGAVALGAAATAIWIAGHQYYYYDGLYYDYTPSGYVVVTPPVTTTVVTASPVSVTESSDNVINVNIPNDRGGYTTVVIKRSGKGFVGPQGEFYPEFPKVSQLKLMYGK